MRAGAFDVSLRARSEGARPLISGTPLDDGRWIWDDELVLLLDAAITRSPLAHSWGWEAFSIDHGPYSNATVLTPISFKPSPHLNKLRT